MTRPRSAPEPAARRVAGLVVLVGVVLLVGVPLGAVLRVAAGDGWSPVAAAADSPDLRAALVHTLTIAAAVTVLAVSGGATLALAVHRGAVGHPRLVLLVTAIPLLVPEFVLAYGWSQAYGVAGLTDQALGIRLPGLFGPGGIILVLACHALPLAYLAVAAGLAVRAEADLERAARVCGAGRWTTLRTITLPLLRRPLLAAGALVFAGSVNSFAVPQVLGGPDGYSTMSTLLYSDLSQSSAPAEFTQVCLLACAMVLLVLLALAPADLAGLLRWSPAIRSGPGATMPARRGRGLRGHLPALGIAAYGLVAVAVPLAAVTASAVTRAPGLPPVPRNWTADNLRLALTGQALPALARSIALAATAAVLLTVLGCLVVALGRRADGPTATAVTLGFAVPGSALAVGLMIGYGRWLVGTWVIVLLAYLAKFWTLAHRPIAAGMDRIAPELGYAARVAGAGRAATVRTVLAPLTARALGTGAALVFLFALHEVTMSSILYGPGSETVAVVVLNLQQLGDPGPTSALALVLTVPPLAAALGWSLLRAPR